MPPSNPRHITEGRIVGSKWVPKAKPARGTTHRRTRKASTADTRARTYASWPRVDQQGRTWSIFVPVKTGSEGNFRGGYRVTKGRKDRQQRALFDVLSDHRCITSTMGGSILEDCARPKLPVVVRLVRITTRKSRIDRHAEWHKHLVDECARWLGCDDGDECSVTWLFDHETGPTAGVCIEVKTRTAEIESMFARHAAERKAVGL